MLLNRRAFAQSSLVLGLAHSALAQAVRRAPRVLLRSSWQTVNIGDIAHTPGMLVLFEKHWPEAEVTLWPSSVDRGVDKLLLARFPKLRIAMTKTEREQALAECDFVLHGSGPGLVGAKEMELARAAGKPFGFGGVTLNDTEIKEKRELLSQAKFVYCRDTASLSALRAAGITGPHLDFGPDATFAIDLRDEAAADALLKQHQLEPGKFLCAVPRLRWTPYWEIHPESRALIPERVAVNEQFAEIDHAKQREGIIAWVRQTGMRVLLAPEMTYAVSRLRPLLYEKLPDDVKPQVAVMDRYWLTAEAVSVYARAAAVLSFELHSPIMAIASETPAVLLRQPTDTRKGQMWRDLKMERWIFEIDPTTGPQIAQRIVEIGKDLTAARLQASTARAYAHERMAAMIERVKSSAIA